MQSRFNKADQNREQEDICLYLRWVEIIVHSAEEVQCPLQGIRRQVQTNTHEPDMCAISGPILQIPNHILPATPSFFFFPHFFFRAFCRIYDSANPGTKRNSVFAETQIPLPIQNNVISDHSDVYFWTRPAAAVHNIPERLLESPSSHIIRSALISVYERLTRRNVNTIYPDAQIGPDWGSNRRGGRPPYASRRPYHITSTPIIFLSMDPLFFSFFVDPRNLDLPLFFPR
jgi:hypothetical protein